MINIKDASLSVLFCWDSQRDSDSLKCRFLTQSLRAECRNLNICLCFEGTKGKNKN